MITNLESNYIMNYYSDNGDDEEDIKPLPKPDPEDDDIIFKRRKDKKRNT